MYMSKVKKFFDRLNPEKYEISKRDIEDIRISLMPKKITRTKDEIPTKDELKLILSYLSLRNRALFLFMLSSGVRIGAALQLKINDLHLEEYPPVADILPEYTKGKIGRTVFFTPEAKDALNAWLNIKDKYQKKRGKTFDVEKIVDVNYATIMTSWNRSLDRAKLGKRDTNTKLRMKKYHPHTLRKFFRTQMGQAGMPDIDVHALMGHKEYLSDSYDRPQELADSYIKYMNAVTIFEKDLETEMRDKLAKGEAEIKDLTKEKQETKMTLSIIAMNLEISNPHELVSDSLLMQINNAIAKMKSTLESNAEEIAYLKEIHGGGPP